MTSHITIHYIMNYPFKILLHLNTVCTLKLILRNLNEVNVGEQVSKLVVVHSRAPTGRILCICYITYQCASLRMQYVYCATCAKTWNTRKI